MSIQRQEQAIEHIKAIEAHIQGLEELVNAESEQLRETWSEERIQLTTERKEQYEPGTRKAGKESYSQMNFYARTWPGGMELSWYTCNYDKKGNRFINFLPKGPKSRSTHTYYTPNIRKPSRKWEWPLVKETEKQATLLRIARAKILRIRSALRPVEAALDMVDIESVRDAFKEEKPAVETPQPAKKAARSKREKGDKHVAPTPIRQPQPPQPDPTENA